MKNLVFDSQVVLALWLQRLAQEQQAALTELLTACAAGQSHGWISSASLAVLEQQYAQELHAAGLDASSAKAQTQTALTALCQQLRLLSNFGYHAQAALASKLSYAEQQLALAAAELQGATVLVVAAAQPASAVDLPELTPIDALQWLQADQSRSSADFIDLKTQQDHIRPELEQNILRVLQHGQYVMGAEITTLETQLAEYVGAKHCIANASGTDALLIAMMALGIKAGDEVITTPFTFIATGEMIALLGAKPVFVDIDPVTYNLDPAKLEAAITANTKAIMPVSLYGQCAEFTAINAVAAKYNIPVIEDAAQSFGATYHGKFSCNLSTIGCTSFFPSKPLGGYGDGGACFTNDDELAKIMREIRLHGQDRRYHHPRIGINGRLDTLQAAVLLAKFRLFPQEVKARAEIGQYYSELIAAKNQQVAAEQRVVAPFIAPHNTSVYAQYTVLLAERDAVQQKLTAAGLATAVHYPIPLHKQPALATEAFDLQVSERIAEQVISLPMHPYLTRAEQQKVIDTLFACL